MFAFRDLNPLQNLMGTQIQQRRQGRNLLEGVSVNRLPSIEELQQVYRTLKESPDEINRLYQQSQRAGSPVAMAYGVSPDVLKSIIESVPPGPVRKSPRAKLEKRISPEEFKEEQMRLMAESTLQIPGSVYEDNMRLRREMGNPVPTNKRREENIKKNLQARAADDFLNQLL
tara:strand:+ start:85 stop:600 length:516 start_codon:yes stop_codon:yes gene_type:complete